MQKLQEEIDRLQARLKASEANRAELQVALENAKTQMVPLANDVFDLVHDQNAHKFVLSLDLSRLMQDQQARSSTKTPSSR